MIYSISIVVLLLVAWRIVVDERAYRKHRTAASRMLEGRRWEDR